MSNQNYRKKPVVIQALKWTGENADEVLNFGYSGPRPLWGADFQVNTFESKVEILTLEGVITASIGDYIIRGVKGEFYPCKPDIFEATYEAANTDISAVEVHSKETMNEVRAALQGISRLFQGIGSNNPFEVLSIQQAIESALAKLNPQKV